ncbi:MAG: 2-C-methyl-D-erythritol 2,4-cyclodiphosphate synthase [Prevotellaceae bacterium]|jgi:2-C-methyl-D-erythritol 2,4-cyclodiphosphate synthase|nr:2-C-methyl-D-erythritol 2,4-cyclodiphosphate synthase [Prevotellaceae bacterium]
MCPFRIGNGFDVHRLADGRPLWLGGVHIPHRRGCVAHSDGDVLIHAICDALLGAAALRDIGVHFPDTDKAYKDIDSKRLLEETMRLVRNAGYEAGNVDTVVCLEEPKIKDYIPAMRATLAQVMHIDVSQLSIKATTCEQLGYVGRQEGVAAYAVTILHRKLEDS